MATSVAPFITRYSSLAPESHIRARYASTLHRTRGVVVVVVVVRAVVGVVVIIVCIKPRSRWAHQDHHWAKNNLFDGIATPTTTLPGPFGVNARRLQITYIGAVSAARWSFGG